MPSESNRPLPTTGRPRRCRCSPTWRLRRRPRRRGESRPSRPSRPRPGATRTQLNSVTNPDPDSNPDPDTHPNTDPDADPDPDPYADRNTDAAEPDAGSGPERADAHAVDGGAGYYGQFSNPLPTDPGYFPIGVWGSYDFTAANVPRQGRRHQHVRLERRHRCPGADLATAGSRSLPGARELQANIGSHTTGWMLGDEVDMGAARRTSRAVTATRCSPNAHNGLLADGRLRYTNYGKGVMFWENDAQAAQFVNLPFLGVVSNDIYWMTDPNGAVANHRYGTLPSGYGFTVDKMRRLDALDGQRKPIWNFVEVGWPFTESAAQGGRAIAPAEVRAAVWHSLIAGARGIIYFNHSFAGPCTTHHVLRSSCGATRPSGRR